MNNGIMTLYCPSASPRLRVSALNLYLLKVIRLMTSSADDMHEAICRNGDCDLKL